MKKRILSLLLALTLVCSLLVFPASAVEVLDEGDYGSLHWVLTDDGTVTISGTGTIEYELKDFWSQYSSTVKSIVMEPGVTCIGSRAFYNCSYLESVTIPEGVTSIELEAFFGCSGLANVIIPKSVTTIGDYAFERCRSLKNVTIPDTVTSFGEQVFRDCSGLERVTISADITSIETMTFRGCGSLKSVTIPASVTAIGAFAFLNCDSLQDVYYGGTEEQWNAISINLSNDPLTAATIHYRVIDSGTCGENVIWALDENGVLTISGTGAMEDYTSSKHAPWYENRTEIVTTIIEPGVTSIGDSAFDGCSNLDSVTIPEGVTSIGTAAFLKCSSLKSVVIPDGVTTIEVGAFGNCSSLESVEIPASVSDIGFSVFQNCSSLESVTIPDGVTNIEMNTFYNCSSLKSVVIPDGVTSIGMQAFWYCSSLTSVTIPDSITSIGDLAFSDCTSLTEVEIPDSVTSIGGSAFANCSNLTSVEIPDSITSIGNNAFAGCSSLTSVEIPDSVTSIGNYAFSYCSSLTGVEIPDSVTSIGSSVFEGCSSLTSVIIPDGVTSIGENAFYGCSSLTSVTIPGNTTSIGSFAFYDCSSLTDVYYGGTKEQWNTISIGNENDSLTSATIHYTEPAADVLDEGDYEALHWTLTSDGVLTISGEGAIPWNMNEEWVSWGSMIKALEIEPGINKIEYNAFRNHDSLERVTIPDTVTVIGSYAFNGDDSLERILIPKSVYSIGNDAFSDCSSLAEIVVEEGNSEYLSRQGVLLDKSETQLLCCPGGKTGDYVIPTSVTSIVFDAFLGCGKLTSIVIPDTVTEIGMQAFSGCSSITKMIIPEGITSIGSHLFTRCKSLETVTIPESVTSIGDYAFQSCSSLTDVAIPEGVTSIGSGAFTFCSSLISISVPEHVTKIGTGAFSNCDNLTAIQIAPGNAYFRSENGIMLNKAGTQFICCPGGKTGGCTIPEGVLVVVDGAFLGCSRIDAITVPQSVTRIGENAFHWCDSLTDVYFDGNEDQWATVSIADGNESLTNATIHFGASMPGKIESNPADVTAPVGGTASFTVVASGDVVSYQWQYKTPAGAWKNSSSKTAGYNTDTLTVEATAARNGYQYRCVVTDQDGNTVISEPAALTVAQPMVITGSPADNVGMAGRVAGFAVQAEGEGLSYQWQYKKPGGAWKNCTSFTAGYNTPFLFVSCVTGSTNRDGYQYRCVVTDAYGNTATSESAKLMVFAVKTQPKSAAVSAGETAVFKVVASGVDLTYQWQYKNPATGVWKNSSSVTRGYNTATLNVAATAARNGYQYRCVVTSGSQTITSTAAKLTVG